MNIEYVPLGELLSEQPRWLREIVFWVAGGVASTCTYFALVLPIGMERGGVAHASEWLSYIAILGGFARMYAATRRWRLAVLGTLEALAFIAMMVFLYGFQGAALMSAYKVMVVLVSTALLVGLPWVAAKLLYSRLVLVKPV